MNGPAAKELVEVMMLDDYVSRMTGVRRWEERWITTLDLAVKFNPPLNTMPVMERQKAMTDGVKEITKSILHALRDESQHVTQFGYSDNMICMKVVFVRMEPVE